ncbi:MAG: NosD domain-containing protein, partial [Candidatus Thorarchaeota archaeon]
QGWPGLGTSGDPYLIAGLNITPVVNKAAIEIRETNVFFTIVDCYIDQDYDNIGIYMNNVSNCAIEFTTVEGGGIASLNGNNVVLNHLYIESGISMSNSVYFDNVDAAVLQFSHIDSTSTNGVHAIACDTPQITDTTIVFGGSSRAMYLQSCPDASITGCNVTATVNEGIRCHLSNRTTITGNAIDSYQIGIYLSNSWENEVRNNYFTSTNSRGVSCQNIRDAQIVDNDFNDIGSQGVYMNGCDEITLEGNTFYDTDSSAVSSSSSDNVDVLDNTMDDVLEGVSGAFSDNWTVTDNIITNVGSGGISLDSCTNWFVARNTITSLGAAGVWFRFSNIVIVEENNISEAADGVYFYQCSNVVVTGNSIADVYNHMIYFYEATTTTIEENTGTDCYWGIYFTTCLTPVTVNDNLITDCERDGIYIYNTLNTIITENHLFDCGLVMGTGYIADRYNHTVIGNAVNGLPIYYAWEQHGGTVTGSNYGQVILASCNGTTVTSGSFTDASMGVQLFHSVGITIQDVSTEDNYYGICVWQSVETDIQRFTSTSDTNVPIIFMGGMTFNIQQSSFFDYNGASAAIYVSGTSIGNIADCDFEHGSTAIHGQVTSNIMVQDCRFTDYGTAIVAVESIDWLVRISTFTDMDYGVIFELVDTFEIIDNDFLHCSENGVYLEASSFGNITENIFHHNEIGTYIDSAMTILITNNTFLWNGEYGVYCDWDNAVEVYYNIFGISGIANGYDDTSNNDWDDGSVLGNWWDDYKPLTGPPYEVDGNTDDNYPQLYLPTEPIIDNPLDLSYAEFSTGNTISWQPFDDDLRDWSVEIDSTEIASGIWDQADEIITVNVDGYAYGTYTTTVTIWDVDQNTVTDSVTISVYDDIAPTISHLPNTEAFVDGSGQELVWEVSDLHPDQYQISRDGVELSSGSPWAGTIGITIDGLAVGVYTYSLVITDLDGNSASDSVIVTVVDDNDAPIISSPDDFSYVYGTNGNFINWDVSDAYPSYFELAVDGADPLTEDWRGARITVGVDGLSEGEYTFTLTVYDGSGLSASDSVTVTVSGGPPTPGLPADFMGILLIIGVAAIGIVIVVIVVYVVKKKRAL